MQNNIISIHVDVLYENGYITARQRKALLDVIRIFEKDEAIVDLDVKMLTRVKGRLKRKASVKLSMGLPKIVSTYEFK